MVTDAALSTSLSVLHGVTLVESLKECRPVGSKELLKETYDLNGPFGALNFCDIKSGADSQGDPPTSKSIKECYAVDSNYVSLGSSIGDLAYL